MKKNKTSTDYNRKELITMIAMLRGELHDIVYVDDEIDEDRLNEIKFTLEATKMDTDDQDCNESGGFEKAWFEEFLKNYDKKE